MQSGFKLHDCEHMDGDLLCQMRTLLKLYLRYVVHMWCLLESIHLYAMIYMPFINSSSVKHYILIAYGYPAILVGLVYAVFRQGLPYPEQYGGFGCSDRINDCTYFNTLFECSYMYSTADYIINTFTIVMFILGTRDLSLLDLLQLI